MNRATSIYLDLVRFLAAVVVLLTHLAYKRFTGGLIIEWRTYGNDAVMVFFVLSGYVIAHTVATRDREFGPYLLNRCARLYSVALPAIALTVVLDHLGRLIDQALYAGFWFQGSDPIGRVLHALTFTNELWFHSVRLFTNGPYWSLGYEFWYYMIFAACVFLRGGKRTLGVAALLALVGPKILLLFPIWLLGVAVYRLNTRRSVGERWGWVLFLGSIVAYAAFRAFGLRDALLYFTYDWLGKGFVVDELRWSDEFLSAYVIGILVACNFIGVQAVASRLAPLLTRFERPIRNWAGYTFSIYLFHYPVLQFLAAVLPIEPREAWSGVLLFALTIAVCRLLGDYTEKRKEFCRDLLAYASASLMRRATR
ncbi:MAG TPA: acyltransferase [Gammaproteobacteria bacterium]|nr:acyltransferase [Gammaproteobacteria bacterium]